MHVSKISKAKNAFISVLCASTMAFSLATPYLAFADASDAEMKAQTKVESTVNVDAADEVAGDTNTGAETVEPGTGVTDATNQATDATEDKQTNADPQEVVATETATEVVALNGDEPAPAADQAEKVTVTLYGTNKTTVEVAKGGKLTAAQLTAPSSATFPLWCNAELKGQFVGWFIGKLDGNAPRLKLTKPGALQGGPSDLDYSQEDIWLGNKSILSTSTYTEAYIKVDTNTTFNEATTLFPVYYSKCETINVQVLVDGEGLVDHDWLWKVPQGYKLNGSDVALIEDFYKNDLMKQYAEDYGPNTKLGPRYFQGLSVSRNPNDKTPIAGKGDADFPVLWAGDGWQQRGIYAIYGKEKLADEITLPPVKVKGTTAVKAYGELSGANIPAGAEVAANAETVTSGQAYDELNEAIGDSRIGDIFDIKLMVNGVEVHDGFGELTISLPVSAEYEGHVIVIYHRHQDGSITTSRGIARNGYVNFVVTDLSLFSMEDGGLPPANGKLYGGLAKTGDKNHIAALSLIALMACGFGIASFRALNARSIKRAKHAA